MSDPSTMHAIARLVPHGARVLDLNVGVPKLNERVLMKNALVRIQEYADSFPKHKMISEALSAEVF